MFVPNLDRRQMARWTTLLLVFGLIAALMVSFGAQPAYAADVFYVTAGVAEGVNGDADTDCSLREAVDASSNNLVNADCTPVYGNGAPNLDVIYVPAGTYNLSTTTGPLVLRRNIRLRGPKVNIPAANLTTFTVRPGGASEATIRYNATINNQPLVNISAANIEVEGLTFSSGGGTQTNVYGINITNTFANIEISNNVFTSLTHGVTLRGTTDATNPTDVVGNAFVNMNKTGTLRGIGVYTASVNSTGLQIEENLFQGLVNYAIRFPVIGSSPMTSNVSIANNAFNNVYSAVGMTRNETVSINSNVINTISGPTNFNAVFDIFDSVAVEIFNNTIINSSLPAIRTRGTLNDAHVFNYNRFINTDTLGSGNAIVLDASSNLGPVSIDDNWWGSNDGPGFVSNDNYSDPSAYAGTPTWLAYQIIGSPNPIGFSSTDAAKSELFVDFFSTTDGTTINDNLTGVNVLRRNTPIAVLVPFAPLPIGTVSPSTVFTFEDMTNKTVFTSDGISSGSQAVEFTLDSETVSFTVVIDAPTQVVCDYNDGVFSDVGVDLSEGATIGDRCVLKLTSDPGPSNFVDVTISSDNASVLGFYNTQSGLLSFASPPPGSFNIRFGSVRDSAAVPPVVKWDSGIGINFSALVNGADGAGGDYYADFVDCAIAGVVGTPGYALGACPGLPSIPLTIYDPGVELVIINSDLDLTNPNETDICTFPAFDRTYSVVLTGPPGMRAGAPANSPEVVTVNLLSSNVLRITVAPATRTFTRTDWSMPQTATVTRAYLPPDVAQPNVGVFHYTTSTIATSALTVSLYYDDGIDTNSDSIVDGLNTTLTVVNPGCPLLGKDDAVDAGISASVSASSVNVGDSIQFVYNYWGSGLASASEAGLLVTIDIPAGVLYLGLDENSSPYCAGPNEGTAGPVTLTCVFPGDVAIYGGGLSINAIASQAGVVQTTATVTTFGGADTNASNNSASSEALVN